MPVRLGKLDLPSVQAIAATESRMLVEQRVIGHPGGVFQDLGRRAVLLRVQGLLLGTDALSGLESLRKAEADAVPLTFTADITAGIDFTDVLVESIEVEQLAGHKSRYAYTLWLREHVEEPEPVAAELAAVDAGVAKDAAGWAGGAVGASAALQDVTNLPDAIAANPGLLDHLSLDDLVGALGGAAASLDTGKFGKIMSSLGLDPATMQAVLDRLKTAKLADLVAVYEAFQSKDKLLALLGDKALLERLGVADLSRLIGDNLDDLAGAKLAGVIKGLANLDPAKLLAVIDKLRDAGSLGEVMKILAAGGIDLLGDLVDIDLGPAADAIKDLADAAVFLHKLANLVADAAAVVDSVRRFDPIESLRSIVDGEGAP